MASETLRTPPRTWLDALNAAGSAVVIIALLTFGFLGGHLLQPGSSEERDEGKSADDGALPLVVTLPERKLTSAGIHVVASRTEEIQAQKTVAATIDYDSTRRLVVRAPVDCVVQEWLVAPGREVAKGDVLARLSGGEVALARSEVTKSEAEVKLAEIEHEWTRETQANLVELLAALKQNPGREEIAERFGGKRLGEHRDRLIKLYTELQYADTVARRSEPLGRDGVIAGRTAESRMADRHIAATAFQSACEQSEHDGRHELAEHRAKLELSQQSLAVAQQRLQLLLGPYSKRVNSLDTAQFEIVAPFAGKIEETIMSPGARISKGEPVLTVADTSRLWVSALIHQHDWDALPVSAKDSIDITIPGLPGETFPAKISFIGAKVSQQTRAISMVAELPNDDGRFRPGMFAWAALPIGAKRKAIVVPTSAVQRHESQAFVFTTEDANRFRRVDVTIGLETRDFIEITDGLSEGAEVVDAGAFYLKSELLLEQDEE